MNCIGIRNLKKKTGKIKVILLLLLLAVIIFAVLFGTGIIGGGFGFGGGSDGADDPDNGSSAPLPEESNVIAIRIEESSIYFGEELCAGAEELKQKITEIGSIKEYELIHDSAIKSVYDQVVEVLSELETALEIKVEYN